MSIPPFAKIPVGTQVKVWFDKKDATLIAESDSNAMRCIYGICLGDVEFGTELTKRGAVRCFAAGKLLADPFSNEGTDYRVKIMQEAGEFLEFYWWRDKSWPLSAASKALIAGPHGGFPTCAAIDPR